MIETANPINSLSHGSGVFPEFPPTNICATWTGYIQLHNGLVLSGLIYPYGNAALTDAIPNDLNTQQIHPNHLVCVDTNGKNGPNMETFDIFYFNFNATGDFDGTYGTVYKPSANNKNFYYGDVSTSCFWTDGQKSNAVNLRNSVTSLLYN